MKKILKVFEYDKIICNPDYIDDSRYTYLDQVYFNELVTFIKEYNHIDKQDDILRIMNIGYKRNVGEVITINNFVGLIQTKSGMQIEVLPKITLSSSVVNPKAKTKEIFLKMLCCLKDFPSIVFYNASVSDKNMSLYEIFISMYIQEVNMLIKKGIISSYISKSDNLNYYKGKLLVNKQLQVNAFHKERFYMKYDEFDVNIPENKIIKTTLEMLHKVTSSSKNSKDIKRQLVSFEKVNTSTNIHKDFSKIITNRNTKNYKVLLEWSKIFLMSKSFTTFAGSNTANALLFPMEKVYEDYVGKHIRKLFINHDYDVSLQDKGYHLFNEPRKVFALRPDIVVRKDNTIIVMDTKWKRLSNNPSNNYGIQQSDMYQMYAYSKKYLCDTIWLLYPLHNDVSNALSISFISDDNTTIKIFFVDVENIEDSIKELMQLC